MYVCIFVSDWLICLFKILYYLQKNYPIDLITRNLTVNSVTSFEISLMLFTRVVQKYLCCFSGGQRCTAGRGKLYNISINVTYNIHRWVLKKNAIAYVRNQSLFW